eukprot:COSAG02_NODE_124_length_35047_cov_31.554179_21_plen_104_part_00
MQLGRFLLLLAVASNPCEAGPRSAPVGDNDVPGVTRRLLLEHGYIVSSAGTKTFIGTSWSQVQPALAHYLPDLGPLPGNVADVSPSASHGGRHQLRGWLKQHP